MLVVNGIGWFGENGIRYVVDHVGGATAFGLMVGWGLAGARRRWPRCWSPSPPSRSPPG